MAASEAAVGAAVYFSLRRTLEEDLAQRLERTASAMALTTDGDLVAQFRKGDQELGAYRIVRARLAQQALANAAGRAFVVDRGQRTLVDSNEAGVVGAVRYSLLAHRGQFDRAWQGGAISTPIYIGEEGAPRLTALAPVRNARGVVTAVLEIDAAPQFFVVLGNLRRQMALLSAVSLGVTALGGLVLVRGAARRLDRVRDTVGRASRGDFTAQLDQRAQDPVGALERDLDSLLESVVMRLDYYESLLASVDIGLIAADLNGTVVGANTTAARWLTGGRRLQGEPLVRVMSLDPGLAAVATEALLSTESGFTREVVVRQGEASGRTLAAVASPLVQGGRRSGVTLSISDVTALRALERQAEAHQRLAALGTMAAGLLHEVRSPLASIMMHLDLLRPSLVDREGVDVLDQAVEASERLTSFLEDFQIVAGLRPLRRDWVDLSEIIEGVVDRLQSPSNVHVQRSSSAPLVINADRDLLQHAVRNLLGNAVDALRPRGGQILVHSASSGVEVCLSVRDSGPGIAPEHLDYVFDPMFTTKLTGTGLGLTIVKRVFEAHGGTVTAANSAGGGAIFTAQWPHGRR